MSSLLKTFRLNDEFLGAYEKLVIEQVIPYQEKYPHSNVGVLE